MDDLSSSVDEEDDVEACNADKLCRGTDAVTLDMDAFNISFDDSFASSIDDLSRSGSVTITDKEYCKSGQLLPAA